MFTTNTSDHTANTSPDAVAGLRIMHTSRLIPLDAILKPGQSLTIGRTHQQTIRIQDDTVSRAHCVITRTRRGRYITKDTRSKNGLWVSRYGPYGEYEKKQRIRLRVGMHVQLGDVTVVAVDADGGAPIIARRYSEFIMRAYQMLGNAQEVARQIGRRSQSVILRMVHEVRGEVTR